MNSLDNARQRTWPHMLKMTVCYIALVHMMLKMTVCDIALVHMILKLPVYGIILEHIC